MAPRPQAPRPKAKGRGEMLKRNTTTSTSNSLAPPPPQQHVAITYNITLICRFGINTTTYSRYGPFLKLFLIFVKPNKTIIKNNIKIPNYKKINTNKKKIQNKPYKINITIIKTK